MAARLARTNGARFLRVVLVGASDDPGVLGMSDQTVVDRHDGDALEALRPQGPDAGDGVDLLLDYVGHLAVHDLGDE